MIVSRAETSQSVEIEVCVVVLVKSTRDWPSGLRSSVAHL